MRDEDKRAYKDRQADQGEADNNSAPECEQRTGVVVQATSQTRVSESRKGRVRQVAGVGVIMVHESCRGAGYE